MGKKKRSNAIIIIVCRALVWVLALLQLAFCPHWSAVVITDHHSAASDQSVTLAVEICALMLQL